jgi:hypothetical protein
MSSVDVPLPPIDETALIVGDGVSDESGPDQFTTLPSEYVCLTLKAYVPLFDGLARNENAASSPVATEPPVHVTRSTTAASPLPFVTAERFQPGLGKNESIPKPLGGVNSTAVVAAPSFSVGTASVKTSESLAATTLGLTFACAEAAAVMVSAATTASAAGAVR